MGLDASSARGSKHPMTPFGTLPDGAEVHRIELAAGDLRVGLLTLGALTQDVRLAGLPYGLTLGSPDLAAYLGPMLYFGTVVAPVANRIGGAAAEIDGRRYEFERNFGPHTLHSGSAGTHGKVWRVEEVDGASATLAIDLPDGEGGFPGNRTLRAVWTATPPATLSLVVTAETDAPTILIATHHPYWNLDGTETWEGHRLQIAADRYLPVDDVDLTTGEVLPIDGTRFDFRAEKVVPFGEKYDNSLCLADARRPLTHAGTLTGASGLTLDVATTEPALHVYDGSGAAAEDVAGHDNRRYGPRAGLALEPQFWPDATNKPHFPDITVRPREAWRMETRYTFRRP